jgi:hypothetical protein
MSILNVGEIVKKLARARQKTGDDQTRLHATDTAKN